MAIRHLFLCAVIAAGCGKDAPSEKAPVPSKPLAPPTPPPDPAAVPIAIAADGTVTSPPSIEAAVKRAHAATGNPRCELSVEPSAKWRAALNALDACLRAGAKALTVNDLVVTVPTTATGQLEPIAVTTVINLDASGPISIDGKTVSNSELATHLATRAEQKAKVVLIAAPDAPTGTVVSVWSRIAAAKLPVRLAFTREPVPPPD